MATPLTQTHPLLSIPFNAATDFTELAGYCELCAETLLESDDPALRMAKRSSSPKRVYPMFNWCPFCKGTEILVAMKIESQWMTVSMMLTQIFNGCLRSVNEAIALRQRRDELYSEAAFEGSWDNFSTAHDPKRQPKVLMLADVALCRRNHPEVQMIAAKSPTAVFHSPACL